MSAFGGEWGIVGQTQVEAFVEFAGFDHSLPVRLVSELARRSSNHLHGRGCSSCCGDMTTRDASFLALSRVRGRGE